MGLFDYILEKALKLPPALLYRHECVDLAADALPSIVTVAR